MKTKVMIIEDEPIIAQEIALNLEARGFEIQGIYYHSEKALEALFHCLPDIVLIDIAIQGIKNGIEVARVINDNYRIPFIFLTSFSDEDTIAEASETLPYGYLVKPFKDDDIAPAIAVAISKYKSLKNEGLPSISKINKSLSEDITEAEYRVISRIWCGENNAQIAESCYISINTVKSHIHSINRKFGVNSKPLLIQFLRNI